jgi:hypothetical protein
VGIAGHAAVRLRIGLGRTLAERGGLSLAGAQGVVESPGQRGDLGFEFGDTLEEFPTAGTRGLIHADIVMTGTSSRPDEGLIKYLEPRCWRYTTRPSP